MYPEYLIAIALVGSCSEITSDECRGWHARDSAWALW